jgi:hypothetical protein
VFLQHNNNTNTHVLLEICVTGRPFCVLLTTLSYSLGLSLSPLNVTTQQSLLLSCRYSVSQFMSLNMLLYTHCRHCLSFRIYSALDSHITNCILMNFNPQIFIIITSFHIADSLQQIVYIYVFNVNSHLRKLTALFRVTTQRVVVTSHRHFGTTYGPIWLDQ